MTEESPHVQYEPCARIETIHDGGSQSNPAILAVAG
jgi:hypothetical protein